MRAEYNTTADFWYTASPGTPPVRAHSNVACRRVESNAISTFGGTYPGYFVWLTTDVKLTDFPLVSTENQGVFSASLDYLWTVGLPTNQPPAWIVYLAQEVHVLGRASYYRYGLTAIIV